MKKTFVGILLTSMCLFSACYFKNPDKMYLATAQRLVDEFPDSAALYLDSITDVERMKIRDQHLYQLLSVQIKDKLHKDLSQDTSLFCLRGIYDKSDPAMASAIYYYSALVYEEQFKYGEAMEECLKAEKLSDGIHAKQNGLIQNTLGRMLQKQIFMDEAREKYHNSLAYFREIKDIDSEILTNNQIGNTFLVENHIDSAFSYYNKCIELLPYLSSDSQRVSILINLAIAYRISGEYQKAHHYLEEALNYPLTHSQLARINFNLAEVNIDNSEKVYAYLDESLRLAEKEGDLSLLSSIYSFLSSYEENRGEYVLALDYYKKRFDYRQKFLDTNFNESMLEIQQRFHVKELQNRNMILTIREQRYIIVGLIFTILLSVCSVCMYRQQRNLTLANNLILHLQKMSLEYNEQEKSLKNIVLKHFNLLKKVALLENYMVHNATNSRFVRKLHEIVYDQEVMDWDSLYETMNSLHNNLFNKMRENFPVLSDHDFKICCLTIARLSNSEIGIILNNAASTIQYRKTYIRKKLNMPRQGNISDFFKERCSGNS